MTEQSLATYEYIPCNDIMSLSISDSTTWEDHTTVTPLEKFQARLENIFRDWYLQWSDQKVKLDMKLESVVEYGHYKFLIIYSPPITHKDRPFPYYHHDLSILMSKKFIQSPLDFLPLYCDFILLGPYSTNISQTREFCKLIQSCAYMALRSIFWNIPVFVVSRSDLPHFHGIASTSPSTIFPNYLWHMAHFTEQERFIYMIPKRIQEQNFLSDIHSYITQRICYNAPPMSNNTCTMMMGYSISIKPWSDYTNNQLKFNNDSISLFSLGTNTIIPFGHIQYPMDNIDRIHLDAIFYSNIPQNRSPRFLDGDKFTISIQKRPFSSFNSAILSNITVIWKTLYEECIINKYRSTESAPYAYPALFKKAKLREYLSDKSMFFKHKHIFYRHNEDIFYHNIDKHFDLLESLFTTDPSRNIECYDSLVNEPNMNGFVIPKSSVMYILSRYFISILVLMTQSKPFESRDCVMDYLPIMADIWRAFCLVLRYHWETLTLFTLPADVTDRLFYRSSLSVQKIFLLNYCIQMEKQTHSTDPKSKEDISLLLDDLNIDRTRVVQRLTNNLSLIKRHLMSKIMPKNDTLKQFALKTDDDIRALIEMEQDIIDEEPFFDAVSIHENSDTKSLAQLDGNECLLFHPDEPLYVPKVQQLPQFLSQDLIDARMNALESVDNGEERIKIQCEQLYSDIQAFKDVNPKASFEDFIRWYSPRDWNKDEGQLSTRMRKSDSSNIWLQLWNSAPACPISKQSLLLDHRGEAERILCYFDDMSVLDFCVQTIPTIVICISEILSDSDQASQTLLNMLKIFPWKELNGEDGLVIDDLIGRVYDLEEYRGIREALMSKFTNNDSLVQEILRSSKVVISRDTREYQAMKQLILSSDQKSMLDPVTSERIVLREQGNDSIQDITFVVNQDSHGKSSSNLIYMLHRNNKMQ